MKAWLASCVAIAVAATGTAQVSTLNIRILEGEGTVHRAGGRTPRPLTIEVTDESRRPVAGATITFQLPESGPGGTFANGLRTDVQTTDSRGRATARAFQANQTPGRFQVRITVLREQAHAGTVSFQYIGEPKGGIAQAGRSKGRKKWLILAAVAGAAAAGGIVAGTSGGERRPPAPGPPPLSIGAPTITVGRP
jgi:hypothetical protein